MKVQKFETVDQYINSFPENTKHVLLKLRTTVLKLIPEAAESMSYGIPTYKLHGKPVVYFAGWKDHVSLYPTPNGMEKFKQELKPYATGKGTAQFKLESIPYDLIEKIVMFRAQEVIKRS